MEACIQLNDLESDLLGELFNIAVGKAASSLSLMLHQTIDLSVPEVDFVSTTVLSEYLAEHGELCSVSQQMDGPFSANTMLLFPEKSSLNMVRLMLGSGISDELIYQMHAEALMEISNIVLNACIGAFAESLSESFTVDIPCFRQARGEDLFPDEYNTLNNVLFIRINLSLSDTKEKGYIVFLFGAGSFESLHHSLAKILQQYK